MRNVRLICVRTINPMNAGFILRACANFDVFDINFISPSFSKEDYKILMTAKGESKKLLENIKIHESIISAVLDCSVAIGFTRRKGLKRQISIDLEKIPGLIKKHKVALLFGPEDNGLTQEDLSFCSHTCQIPTSTLMQSMNLSHAVSVVLYSIFSQTFNMPTLLTKKSKNATISDLKTLEKHLEKVINDLSTTKKDNPKRMLYYMKNTLNRSILTVREVAVFHAFLKKIEKNLKSEPHEQL